jgi:Ala-tRNA(Pro) deacylase
MNTITGYLGKRDVKFETLAHRHTMTANQTASEVRVPRQRVAKGVLFCDDETYVLAVVPASHRVDPEALAELLGLDNLDLASEDELANLFPDCEPGAVPAVGAAYGIPSIVDAALLAQEDVYLEAGDHQHVVHITGEDFRRIMSGVSRGNVSLQA